MPRMDRCPGMRFSVRNPDRSSTLLDFSFWVSTSAHI